MIMNITITYLQQCLPVLYSVPFTLTLNDWFSSVWCPVLSYWRFRHLSRGHIMINCNSLCNDAFLQQQKCILDSFSSALLYKFWGNLFKHPLSLYGWLCLLGCGHSHVWDVSVVDHCSTKEPLCYDWRHISIIEALFNEAAIVLWLVEQLSVLLVLVSSEKYV